MRKMLLAAVAVAVVATASLGSAGAFASTPRARSTTIRLTAHFTHQEIVDTGPTGPSPGDVQVGIGTLSRGGKVVGRFGLVCEFLTVGQNPTANCSTTGRLPHGTITLEGFSNQASDDQTWAVVGGTGNYRDAAGQALIHGVDDTTSEVTIELD